MNLEKGDLVLTAAGWVGILVCLQIWNVDRDDASPGGRYWIYCPGNHRADSTGVVEGTCANIHETIMSISSLKESL